MPLPGLVRQIRRFRLWSRLALALSAVMAATIVASWFSRVHVNPLFQAIAVFVPLLVGVYLQQQAIILVALQRYEGDHPEYAKGVTKRTTYFLLFVFSSLGMMSLFAVAIFAEGPYVIVALCLVPIAFAGVVIATVGRWRVTLATLRAGRRHETGGSSDSGGGEDR